jgi:hypothetical protein
VSGDAPPAVLGVELPTPGATDAFYTGLSPATGDFPEIEIRLLHPCNGEFELLQRLLGILQ